MKLSLLFKRFFVGALALFSFSFFAPTTLPTHAQEIETLPKDCAVEHLFTHALIAHPEIAFQTGNSYAKNLDEDCLTANEFSKILETLYQNDYALVNPLSLFEIQDGSAKRVDFPFYKDKKPLILSFDDVVYTEKNKGKGMIDRLALSSDGEILAETDGKRHKQEFLPILENFIKKHPDFSYQNARGILFLTGFDGILGYRTQRDSPNRASETKEVKKIVRRLKDLGWVFGSHSYAHGHMKNYSEEKMQSDLTKWKTEVEPIVGKTPFYAYPYGEWETTGTKAEILTDGGFSFFFGVGEYRYFTSIKQNERIILFQDRCPMDGISLRKGICERFFDGKSVYDPLRIVPFL